MAEAMEIDDNFADENANKKIVSVLFCCCIGLRKSYTLIDG